MKDSDLLVQTSCTCCLNSFYCLILQYAYLAPEKLPLTYMGPLGQLISYLNTKQPLVLYLMWVLYYMYMLQASLLIIFCFKACNAYNLHIVQWVLCLIFRFISANIIHVLEGAWTFQMARYVFDWHSWTTTEHPGTDALSVVVCRKLQLNAVTTFKWTIQTTIIGFSSLFLIKAKADLVKRSEWIILN